VSTNAIASPPSSASWARADQALDGQDQPVAPDVPDTTITSSIDEVPPLSPRLQLLRAALIMVFVLSLMLLLQLLVFSPFQQRAAQQRAYDRFRAELATGTAPVGPTDSAGRILAPGAPVAYLEIPSIGLRQVVGQGTAPAVLFDGPGHRRDTPLPGQAGTSVVMGRRAAFGGPFAKIGKLDKGDTIRVTTGQGVYEYKVTGVRREGDPVPDPPAAGEGRLLLATADGRPFFPNGVLRVDADLQGTAAVGPARLVTAAALPAQERFMGIDTRTLWALALWMQALILLLIGAVWSWHRWGHAQTWVVFLPPLLFVGLAASGEVARLLPNLA
jgi:sortase A